MLRDVSYKAGSIIKHCGGSQFDDGQGKSWQVFLRLRTLRPSSSAGLPQQGLLVLHGTSTTVTADRPRSIPEIFQQSL
jgi:hypothetical protein